MSFIPDEQYEQILKCMPVFCVDWLISCKGQYLLLKRTQQPLMGDYWIVGGRLRMDESITVAACRLQMREVGRFCGVGKMIGFSNYMFDKVEGARATHTPAVSYQIEVDEMFTPTMDSTESEYIWTDRLPTQYLVQTQFTEAPSFKGLI
jgi:colanic acid biosynthesis protein WcaH